MNELDREAFEKLNPMPEGIVYREVDQTKTYTHSTREFVREADLYRHLWIGYQQGIAQAPAVPETFQNRVNPWLIECFGVEIARNKPERNHRFLEESLELVQSLGCTKEEAAMLVDYVYGRDVGDPPQEVGGVMVTLAAACLANNLDMHDNGETELKRIWTKVPQIREKQRTKPKSSPLPMLKESS